MVISKKKQSVSTMMLYKKTNVEKLTFKHTCSYASVCPSRVMESKLSILYIHTTECFKYFINLCIVAIGMSLV